jgi:ABC-2 type transport system ATP-binding protein
MHTPRLLLLDEPTAGVDPKARRDFWDEIHGFASDGMTVLVSTHYMDEAERCHRINYIFDGRLLTGGTVAEVIDQAGLTTIVLEGARADEAIDRLSAMDGVDQVAPFGLLLHVVGQDRAALQSSVDQIASEFGLVASQGSTSLEDVFIQLMKAPMAAGS